MQEKMWVLTLDRMARADPWEEVTYSAEQEGGGGSYSTFRFNEQASVSHAPQTDQQYQ